MIIQSSSINTSASRRYSYSQSSYTELSEWDNSTGSFSQETSSDAVHIEETSGSVLNQETNAWMERFQPISADSIPTVQERLEIVRNMKQKTLDYLLQILFGEETRTTKGDTSQTSRKTSAAEKSALNPVTITAESIAQPLGTGGQYKSFYYCAEKETTCFHTTGTAITADGRSLSFNISLEMSRSFIEMSSEQIDFGQPRLCDPLVINLNTNVASVSDQKFFFDIDADGTEDEISMLDESSGYLALDNNNDGTINDGSELFGTSSGNGFKDLLAYDEDENGWIDEADSIFQKLKIWTMDENGNSTLIDLKEAGVGAIYLGYENTEFSLKDTENKTNAVIQKTGLFLYENGMSGTVQQMDLAV